MTGIWSANPRRITPQNIERIRRRAYEKWERAGGVAGHDQKHWLKAEREIEAESRAEGGIPVSEGSEPAKPANDAGSGD